MSLQPLCDADQGLQRLHRSDAHAARLQQTNQFEVDKQRETRSARLRTILDRPGKRRRRPVLQLEQRLRDLENQRTRHGGRFDALRELLLALGSALLQKRRPGGGRGELEGRRRRESEADGEAHNNLAVIYMQTGRFDDAEQELKLAEKTGFRVNPQFKDDLKESARTNREVSERCGGR